MKTILEYLTEDFQSGLQKFMANYVTPVINKPPKTIHELQKTRLFVEFAKNENEILDNMFYNYQDINPSNRMFNIPHNDPEDYSEFRDYLEVMDDYDESLFVKFIVDSIIEKLNNHIKGIEWYIKSGMIHIYRAMTVSIDYINHLKDQGKRIGIYWTVDEDMAEPYGSDGDLRHRTNSKITTTAVIETNIHENYIDWERTLFARIDYVFGDQESEITLFKGTPIKILRIYDKDTGEDFDISAIANKTFYA